MSIASAVLIFALMVFLGAASAFFSAMETALFSLQRGQLDRLRAALPGRAATIEALFANPRRLLSMILLADTVSNLPLCLLALYVLHAWEAVGAAGSVPFWSAAFCLFVLVVGICDLLPKVIALRKPERVAAQAVEALHYLRPLLDPLCGILETIGEKLADWITPKGVSIPLKLTEDEFEAMVEVGAEEGALQAAESEMIQEIIKLGDKTAKDCMTPRVETFALADDLTNAEALTQLRVERYHRVPVYGATPDDILGILNVRKFLLSLESLGSEPSAALHYSEVLDPPSYVSESMRALDLMRGFLTHPQGMAIVVDEYGGTEGIVTLADIIEEIIGDAVPSGGEDLYIEALDENRLLVGGHARLDDISEHPGFELEAEGLDTISGLVFNRLGYLPKAGEVLRLPHLKLTIRQVTRKRIGEVLIEKQNGEAKTKSSLEPPIHPSAEL
jgi:putative hemolysin